MRGSPLTLDSQNMSRSAWESPQHMGDDLDGLAFNATSRQSNVNISRSQDDATVSYHFQRPQSENDLQSFAGGKRWPIGDDTLVEQAKSVSDLEREFNNINLGSDFSTKKFWEVDDGHISDGKGAMFSASSPWSPRHSTWSSPTTDHTVPQALPLSPGRHNTYQNVLGSDMVDYVLGDPLGKTMSSLRIKHDFSHDPENDSIKAAIPKSSKTSSPFEPIENNNKSGDSQSELLINNGDDGFREEEQVKQPPSVIGSTPTKKPPVHSSFAPILPQASSALNQLNTSQGYGLSMHSGGVGDVLSYPDYMPMGGVPSLESPANQFSSMSAPPLDIYSNLQQTSQHNNPKMVNVPPQPGYPQSVLQPQLQQPPLQPVQSSLQLSMPPPQQPQAIPQQPPTPGGQPTHMPFAVVNAPSQPQQQQFNMQQHQIAPNSSMSLANPTNTANAPQQQPVYPHPGNASYVINGQEPFTTVGMPVTGQMVPTQLVQMPWGFYPTNIMPPQSMANQQQRPPSGQRPPTPNQQQAAMTPAGDGQQQQPVPMNAAPMQIQPNNFVDMNGFPVFVACYDQNGQLVTTMNNPRGMPGAPIRLISPAPFMFNPGPNNSQQPQQGFNAVNSVNYNNSNGGPASMANVQMNPPMQLNMQGPPQQIPMTSNTGQMNGNNFSQGMNMAQPPPPAPPQQSDFGMPQRQDSFNDHGLYMQSSPAGPLGLVQPPAISSPLGNTSGLGLGSGGRLYSTAPGAEGTYRNSAMPPGHAHSNNMSSTPIFNNRQPKETLSVGRSSLLEDFRNNRIANLQLKDLTHHVVEFSQDQHGSRFIQQKLERATLVEKQHVFNEILTAAYSLMTDVFGNYVIQKFFEFGLPEHKQVLAQRLTGHVLPLANQMYGCRVIQKALESITPEMQIDIVKELDGHVLKCVKDQNGNHVVQKCIECVDPNYLQFIIEAFRGQVCTLSTHPYGCRVIQRILEHCRPDQTDVILSELHDFTDRLVMDQYGNYVIQHVLEHGRLEEKSKIVSHVSGSILQLSQHKFASNVVEKCVTYGSRAEKAVLIEEVCSSVDESGQSALYVMMKDQFANYVIQKMLDISEPNQRKILVHKIRPHVSTLRKYTYGKHIIAKLEKYLMKNGGGDLSGSPLTLPSI